MKLIKYFSLVLVMFAGQAMASGYGYSNNWQVRADAQRLINAERNLLRTMNRRFAGRSHAARDLRVLIQKTLRLKRATYYRTRNNRFVLRNRMRNITVQFRHTRRSIRRDLRLRRSSRVRFQVRRVAGLVRRLQSDVYAVRGYRGRRGHRGHRHVRIWF